MKTRKNKVKTSNIVLIIVGLLTVIFTIVCLWAFFMFQAIPDTLVQMFYSTVVGELLVVGLIRMMKSKYEGGNDDEFGDTNEDN